MVEVIHTFLRLLKKSITKLLLHQFNITEEIRKVKGWNSEVCLKLQLVNQNVSDLNRITCY